MPLVDWFVPAEHLMNEVMNMQVLKYLKKSYRKHATGYLFENTTSPLGQRSYKSFQTQSPFKMANWIQQVIPEPIELSADEIEGLAMAYVQILFENQHNLN